MNDRWIRTKMMNLNLDICVLEDDLISTPWWRVLRNRSIRRSIDQLEQKLKMYEFDYESLADAVLTEQESRKWADPCDHEYESYCPDCGIDSPEYK